MMRALLALLDSGGPMTRESMAESLGVGLPELHDMIERLIALGYVESVQVPNPCDNAMPCKACARCGGCSGRKDRVASISQLRVKHRK